MMHSFHCPASMLQETTEEMERLKGPARTDTIRLAKLWASYQPDGMVYLRDIPSRAMASFLRSIVIWEPVGDWEDARIRMMGSGLFFRFGADLKGRLMSDVFSHIEKPQHLTLLRSAMHMNRPSSIRSHVKCGNIELMTLELLAAPIFDTDGKSPLALVCVLPDVRKK